MARMHSQHLQFTKEIRECTAQLSSSINGIEVALSYEEERAKAYIRGYLLPLPKALQELYGSGRSLAMRGVLAIERLEAKHLVFRTEGAIINNVLEEMKLLLPVTDAKLASQWTQVQEEFIHKDQMDNMMMDLNNLAKQHSDNMADFATGYNEILKLAMKDYGCCVFCI